MKDRTMKLKLLHIGKAKSGNYWLYKIIQEISDYNNIEMGSFIEKHSIYEQAKKWQLSHKDQVLLDVVSIKPDGIFFRIADKFEERIENIDEYLRKCSYVWTHSLYCGKQKSFYHKFDKIVYLVRDPRDVAVSMARFAFTPYVLAKGTHNEKNEDAYLRNRLYGSTIAWVKHVGGYLLHRDELNIHFVFYERLKHDFMSEVTALLDYLDLSLTPDEIIDIKEKTSFSRMKKKNPKHVQKGKAYQWMDCLTSRQKRQVLRIAEPMLAILNYSTSLNHEKKLPTLPEFIVDKDIKSAIRKSRGTIFDKLFYAYYFLRSERSLSDKIQKGCRFILNQPVQ